MWYNTSYPSIYSAEKYDILSAVIEYHSPYQYDDGKQFTLVLTLGDTMSVNSILGLLTIVKGEIEPTSK